MLGSDFDGERASAGLLANRFVKSLGLAWDDVVSGPDAAKHGQYDQRQQEQQQKATPSEMVKFCLDSGLPWNAWEAEFLEDMQFRWKFSPKQMAVLDRLYAQAMARSDEQARPGDVRGCISCLTIAALE